MKVKKTEWELKYKGISGLIICWIPSYDEKERWNYYISIHKKQLPCVFKKLIPEKYKYMKRWYWKYDSMEDYFNMSGGITYYEVLRSEFTGDIYGVKVGCDYGHIWNKEYQKNYKYIKEDLINSIETFIKSFPKYKVWCHGNGNYYKPEEGKFQKSGEFVSNECIKSTKLKN